MSAEGGRGAHQQRLDISEDIRRRGGGDQVIDEIAGRSSHGFVAVHSPVLVLGAESVQPSSQLLEVVDTVVDD